MSDKFFDFFSQHIANNVLLKLIKHEQILKHEKFLINCDSNWKFFMLQNLFSLPPTGNTLPAQSYSFIYVPDLL